MATILHEIGHNFSHRRNKIVGIGKLLQFMWILYDTIVTILYYPECTPQAVEGILLMSNKSRDIYKKIQRFINQNKISSTIVSGIGLAAHLPFDIIYNIKYLINPFRGSIEKAVDTFLYFLMKNNVSLVTGYLDERIADDFATIYGYGPDMVSLQLKFGKDTNYAGKIIHKLPIAGWIYDLYDIPTQYIMQLGDPHPSGPSRAKTQYNYLLNEVKKSNKPRLTKEIEEDIKRCEEVLEDIDKSSKDLLSGALVQDNYNKICLKLKKGDDIREYLTSVQRDSKQWDELYDKALEEK
jgi:hypothetical protein